MARSLQQLSAVTSAQSRAPWEKTTMKHLMTVAALPLFFVAGLAAQQPATPASQPAQPAPRPGTTAQQPATTLTGCLYRENQIAGRTPNVAERAGMMEDY